MAIALAFTVAISLQGEWSRSESVAMSMSILLGIVLFSGFGWYLKERIRERKAGVPASDERTRMIEGTTSKYAFGISYWVILALAWYNIIMGRFLKRSQLPADVSLVIILIAMFALWIGLSWHFKNLES